MLRKVPPPPYHSTMHEYIDFRQGIMKWSVSDKSEFHFISLNLQQVWIFSKTSKKLFYNKNNRGTRGKASNGIQASYADRPVSK